MSDRHKFRVWILKDYDMGFEDSLTPGWLKDQCEWYQLSPNGQEIQWGFGEFPLEPLEIGKDCLVEFCTGLKDKNDRLIFEGDVCKWHVNGRNRIGVVGYSGQGFDLFAQYESLHGIICWDVLRGEIENLGNIHEDRSLLE